MANVTLLHYNNYFNRTIKKLSTVAAYQAADSHNNKITGVNFVPGDGVATSLILGTYSLGMGYDYAVVSEVVSGTETIKSRWFLMEENRTRDGQYSILLKRDVVADFYDDIKDAPCFIEKGIIDDKNNYLLYNNEGYKVNQIKTTESLIKDIGEVPWVVGYVASNLASGSVKGNLGTITLSSSGTSSGNLQLSNTNYISFYITQIGSDGALSGFTYSFNSNTKILTYSINNSSLADTSVVLRYNAAEPALVSGDTYKVNLTGSQVRTHLTDAPYDMFCIPFGAIHLNSANINTIKEAALEIAMEVSKDLGSNLYDVQLLPYCPRIDLLGANKIYEALGVEHVDYDYIYQGNSIKSILIWCKKSTFTFTGVGQEELEVNRPLATQEITKQTSYTNSRISVISSPNASITFYDDAFKTSVVTDIVSFTATNGTYTDNISSITSFSQNKEVGSLTVVYTGTNFPSLTSTTVSTTLNYKYKNFKNPEYLDYKISNECDVYRLVSPNYNGQFEWSIAKSVGSAKYFDIDCTYKPYQPYIHLAPQFTKLYGTDFNDARGLICGGDFSLPVTSDAWTQYQIQNKTYQDMFDRQIKNMDKQFEIESTKNALAGVIGVGQNALIGGVAGAKVGGGAGGALGMTLGAGLSALGLAADTVYNQKLFEENRSYAYDMFNYGLQNIQALPYGLTKVAAYTANNKVFPMVEYYTCSDIEKDAFKNKLQYNGMSVNIISTLNNFVNQNEVRYIKGQIIRLPSLNEDAHIANEIYNEVSKGVYI